jgi:hypothetical protein
LLCPELGHIKEYIPTKKGGVSNMSILFRCLSRFVAMAGIGGIAQSVATDLLARLANPRLNDEEFENLRREAEQRGYVLERA